MLFRCVLACLLFDVLFFFNIRLCPVCTVNCAYYLVLFCSMCLSAWVSRGRGAKDCERVCCPFASFCFFRPARINTAVCTPHFPLISANISSTSTALPLTCPQRGSLARPPNHWAVTGRAHPFNSQTLTLDPGPVRCLRPSSPTHPYSHHDFCTLDSKPHPLNHTP